MIAIDVKVGDVVCFERDAKVRVDTIERNWEGDGTDPHPYILNQWGHSLVFGCTFVDENGDDVCPTVYVRRERSPLTGARVVR